MNDKRNIGADMDYVKRAENIPPLRRPQRKSIRLRGYDYSQAGLYFITICTQNQLHLFGKIVNGKMILNDTGNAVMKCWNDIPLHYPHIKSQEFIIMPNHIHGIVGAEYFPPNIAPNIPPQRGKIPLGNIVRGFKIGVTKWFQENESHPIGESIWQRNYWEHIIRNENEYNRIAQYIVDNPAKWDNDKLNGGTGNQVMESPTPYGQNIFCPDNKEVWIA